MELQDMNLDQVTERLAQLDVEVRGMTKVEDVEAAGETRQALLDRKAELEDLMERQQAVLDLQAGKTEPVKVIESRKDDREMEFNKETVLSSKEYRSAWAKSLMQQPLTEVEERAVGVALTTTATTYVGATAVVDGVNNGGLFIPEDVMLALMERIELVSPFFRDVPKTAVNGYVKFPYRVGGSGAGAQVEGTANADGQVQWAELTLTALEVSETIRVTWKLEAMSIDGFINYIIEELSTALAEKIATEALYGGGTNTLTGVTEVAIDGSYTIGTGAGEVADILEAIEAGLALLSVRKKQGAKIYVSPDVMESVAFMRDGDGRYLHNPINGVGINSFARYAVEVDPFLSEGDFVIGNPRYYRFNWNEGVSVSRDMSGKQRINDYTGYAVCSGNAEPLSFVYGKKS